MYVITDGHLYVSDCGGASTTTNRYKAYVWELEHRAQNVLVNLPRRAIRNGSWRVTALITHTADYDELLKETNRLARKLLRVAGDLQRNKQEFNSGRDLAERQTSDLLHEVELHQDMDAYEFQSQLGDIRRNRRACKDGQAVIREIERHLSYDILSGQLNRILDNQNGRKYTPRVEKEIFKNG